jgi:hypothetical protein
MEKFEKNQLEFYEQSTADFCEEFNKPAQQRGFTEAQRLAVLGFLSGREDKKLNYTRSCFLKCLKERVLPAKA